MTSATDCPCAGAADAKCTPINLMRKQRTPPRDLAGVPATLHLSSSGASTTVRYVERLTWVCDPRQVELLISELGCANAWGDDHPS